MFTKLSSLFLHLDIFFLVEKKIVLVRGKEGRGKGSKRDKRDQKKKFNFFSPHVRSCDDRTAQPHVRCTCGPVRHHCLALQLCSSSAQLLLLVPPTCLWLTLHPCSSSVHVQHRDHAKNRFPTYRKLMKECGEEWERKGFTTAVGWVLVEEGGYVLVVHITTDRMTCVSKSSDLI